MWGIVVPVKPLAVAKARLDTDVPRPDLALAFALDAIEAACGCDEVSLVVVVTSDDRAASALRRPGVVVVPDEPDRGLNAALEHGAAELFSRDGGVAAMLADLPALRPHDLATALRAACRHDRAFVADARRIGTTLLTARPGVLLQPRFGGRSRQAHLESGAVELDVLTPSLRQDVDTAADLLAARQLGLGRHTRALAG